jgi:5-dehydro-2-deoxygluconokinase
MIVGNDVEFGFMAGDYDKGLDKARALAARGRQSPSTRWARRARSPSPTAPETFAPGSTPDRAQAQGAGDAFMAGFISGLACEGHALKEAMLRGSACASITVVAPLAARQPCQRGR